MPRILTNLIVVTLLLGLGVPSLSFAQQSTEQSTEQAASSDGDSKAEPKSASGPSYEVDLSDADDHYAMITMTASPTGAKTDLMMATWTPGSYRVREYAKHIDSITAENEDGPLKIIKTKKNSWVVETPDEKEFTIKYRLFCKEISVRTNFLDSTHGVLTGAATFVTIPEQMNDKHEIKISLPDAWNGSASSMRTVGDDKNHYIAENYDEVVDSPIVAGLVDVYPFEVDGVPHFLVNVNDEGNWDGEQAAKDLKRLVKAHQELWGSVPYDRYYFLNVINNNGGGLEHDHSCLMMASQRAGRGGAGYVRWLGLCSHEFFHTWNVRRLRPKSLVKYDYEAEVYTPSLWIAEGVTSYYEDVLLCRSGITEPQDLVNAMSRMIRGVQTREGRKVQSLRDSSHDAWIKFYRPEENSRDTQVSYYNKGAVAAFLLDVEIRNATGGKKSLDDAMRIMYEKYADGVGYTSSDFRKVCSDVAGTDLNEWFESAIDSTDELDYQNLADTLGMRVGPLMPSNADPDDAPEQRQIPWIGLGEDDSPADEAGLRESDEILAVNGRRTKSDLQEIVNAADIDDELTLLVARRNRIMELELTIGGQDLPVRWGMGLWDEADVRQRVARYRWFREPPEEVVVVEKEEPVVYKWTKKKPVVVEEKKLPLQ